ncbi:orotidine 5'-phosphate decarboxylase [Candidatus Hecatella orcuttiae]|uniref:orotidine 5'-phosphate decarboxylase n=1 Tax=Candidatus Hecatella orcuttiae TaxID=1935119 RepID=UPI002868025A|nr:orotidine 5'-phosphate decarboxylase [Candidatus Hecatella orcuttiae]
MFRDQIQTSAKRKQSNIVLALDLTGLSPERLLAESLNLVKRLSSLICAVKVNRHLTLPLGLRGGVEKIVQQAHRFDLPAIMDCKLNDIGSTNRVIAENFFQIGFDALTVSPHTGWEKGLEPVFTLAREMGKGIITLVYMSHPGAEEVFGLKTQDPETGEMQPAYKLFAKWSRRWKADGAVVGATRPKIISEVDGLLGKEVPIYSPGVGFQGGMVEEAMKSGTRYLIVGRTIFTAKEPEAVAEQIRGTVLKVAPQLF